MCHTDGRSRPALSEPLFTVKRWAVLQGGFTHKWRLGRSEGGASPAGRSVRHLHRHHQRVPQALAGQQGVVSQPTRHHDDEARPDLA